MTPEGKVKKELDEYLETLKPNVWWFKPMTFGYGKSGVPDYIICYRGFFLAPETKKKGGKNEPWQDRQQEEIRRAGGQSERITDLEAVKAWVAQIDAIYKAKGL